MKTTTLALDPHASRPRPRATAVHATLGLLAIPLSILTAGCSADAPDPVTESPGQAQDALSTCAAFQRGAGGTVADAQIESGLTQNAGSSTGLRVANQEEVLVQFDLSAIPTGALVSSATLGLELRGASSKAPVNMHRVTAPWAEDTVTYASFEQQFDGAIDATLPSSGVNTFTSTDVTALAQGWVSGQQRNDGLLLETVTTPTGALSFSSSETTVVGERPRLGVCYVDNCSPNPCAGGAVCTTTGATTFSCGNENSYQVTVLVSNQPGVAPVTDPKLVNAWGLVATATSTWWVSNNGSGSSTLYSGAGVKSALEVTVPGDPTGTVANGGTQFTLAAGKPSRFMWASEDGTISGWNPAFDATHAHVVFTGPSASYKGLAISGNVLYATDFAACHVQAFDGQFVPFASTGGFADNTIPAAYCPFGIQASGSSIFVTYALKDGFDDQAGPAHGFVREFDTNGNLVAHVADHGELNSPWGLAKAPSNFGLFSGCVLVGNFGDGLINAYCKDPQGNYHSRGRLRDALGNDIAIEGLWGIAFGNGASAGPTNVLYFAAGPDDESNGAFGKIAFAP